MPDHLKTQGMCEKAVEEDPYQLDDFPDHLKTQEMCEKAVENESETLEMSLITSRPKRCVKELLKMTQTP